MAHCIYESPIGRLYLTADESGMTGLWMETQRVFPQVADDTHSRILEMAKRWLDIYFAGGRPDFMPALHFEGTDFQKTVWSILTKIPYGETTTYGAIAEIVARSRGMARISAQAVGQAVGRNPISILVPCHRVVGSDGALTGYAGGGEIKRLLLNLEGIE